MDTPSADFEQRYVSQRFVEWWDQRAVGRGRVLVAGVGALGNEAVKDLALAGVGTLMLVDFDRVEVHNLSRCVLFGERDIGKPKVGAAQAALARLNPQVRVRPMDADVETGIGAGVVARCDVVLGCLDSRGARRALNRLGSAAGTPYIDGGLRGLDGAVKTFLGGGPCYECGLTEADYRALAARHPCPKDAATPSDAPAGRVPTLVSAAAITGGLMTQQALRLLCGQPVEGGRCITYRGATMELEHVRLPLREGCPGHAPVQGVEPTGLGTSSTPGELLEDGETLVLPGDVGFGACGCGGLVVMAGQGVGSHVACPRCGGKVVLRLTHHVGTDHPLAGVDLARLGVPPLAWVAVETTNELKYKELDADEGRVFPPCRRAAGGAYRG